MDGEWRADPTGRHELRWHDGAAWTEHVADAGVMATDPYDGGATGAADPAAANAAWPTGSDASPSPSTATPDQQWSTSGPPASTAPSPQRRSGIGAGWVVLIALATFIGGGVIGFVAGVAVDVVDEVGDELSAELDPGGSLGTAGGGPALTLGGTVEGDATTGGTAHPLTLDADTTVRLEVVAADFDTVLEVYDETGELVASDDDGGQDRLSLLTEPLPVGTYEVVVRPFGFGDASGGYTLEATEG